MVRNGLCRLVIWICLVGPESSSVLPGVTMKGRRYRECRMQSETQLVFESVNRQWDVGGIRIEPRCVELARPRKRFNDSGPRFDGTFRLRSRTTTRGMAEQ